MIESMPAPKPKLKAAVTSLPEYLAAYATDVVREWMRIVELPDESQARVTWEAGEDTFTLGDSQYGAEHGRFRLIVKVEQIEEDLPCKAHSPDLCPTLPLPPQPVWQEATFLYIEPEDDIRIPGSTDVADVISVVRGAWHAGVRSVLMPSGKWWDEITAWSHVELTASLAINGGEPTGLIQYPSDTPVEILCTPERAAQLVLARAFLGTVKIGEN